MEDNEIKYIIIIVFSIIGGLILLGIIINLFEKYNKRHKK